LNKVNDFTKGLEGTSTHDIDENGNIRLIKDFVLTGYYECKEYYS
jgi:hypothetical protein